MLEDNWKKFEQKFDLYMTATDLDTKEDKKKIAVFLSLIGEEGLDIYNSFTLTDAEKESLQEIKKKFTEHCAPQKNVIYERFVFNSLSQKEGQTFDSFLTELKIAVKTTEYADQLDMVRDRIVMGIYDKTTQERLLREKNLTLDRAINFCRAVEVSKSQAKALQTETSVNALLKKKNAKQDRSFAPDIKACQYCGHQHSKGKCPAYGKTCHMCGMKNHFANVCKKKEAPSYQVRKKEKAAHEVVAEDMSQAEDSEAENFYVSSLEKMVDGVQSGNESVWLKLVHVEGKPIEFKLDTGAEVSVIPFSVLKKLKQDAILKKTNITLISYGSKTFKIKPMGEINLNCSVKDKSVDLPFIIIDSKNQLPLLGLKACMVLNLVQRIDSLSAKNFNSINDIEKLYPMVFTGLGCFPNEHRIVLRDSAVPHVQGVRRIPQSLLERVKIKLAELEKQGIIRKVVKPTEWLNPVVIVEKKNGDLRLCLDPKYLNENIQREQFLIPTADEIASKLSNKSFFTVLDMKDGYFQVKIDDLSADYCTFGTPFGRYQFCRLPFGISSAPEVFQRKNFELFGDIEGVQIYFDDLIIAGESESEHDRCLKEVLDRAVKYNVKFNKSKIQFKSNEVKFLGQIFSKDGVKPCQSYIKAIVDMPVPRNRADLLRLLGMAKFLGRFVPNLSKVTAPLRNLTRENVEWNWSNEHDESLTRLKHLLTTAPVLKFFDPSLPIEIETDASKDGIGSCLLQDGHPIAFASRSMTKSESSYAQIEKELLAILFSCQRFHYFIYGVKNIRVNSDHRPLEAIFKKSLSSVTPRLQRMLLQLLKYDLNVTYKPGKYLYIADALSRAFLNENDSSELDLEYQVHALTNYLPMSEEKKELFRHFTKNDEQLQLVVKFVETEWPSNPVKIPSFVRHFVKLKNELSVSDDLLFLNYKLVVPKDLRNDMLLKLHEGHLGIEKVKARARQIFYWPLMNQDIEDYIKKCKICEKFARRNVKEKLHSYPIPKRPWERVGADIFSYANKSYLVVMDSYSNWLELISLKNKSAEEIIRKLKVIFSKFGSPDTFVCDNVPFNSSPFKKFAEEWNFVLVLRSPHYPKSNGLAEKAVGIGKKLLKKSLEEGEDIFIALLQYRNSPLKHIGYSPSQLLMSRICKTKLPVATELLMPKLCIDVDERLRDRKGRNEIYYNSTAVDLKPLKTNQNVTIFNHINKVWEPGQIIEASENPRAYKVLDSRGNVFVRNRVDLRESLNEQKHVILNDDVEHCCDGESLGNAGKLYYNTVSSPIRRSTNETATVSNNVENYTQPSCVPADSSSPVKISKVSGRTIRKPKILDL